MLFAQNKAVATYQINAYVNYENSGNSLINTDITIIGNNKLYQTSTDSNGHFCLQGLEAGFYEVMVNTKDSYKEYFDFFVHNYNVEVDFELYEHITTSYICIHQLKTYPPPHHLVKAPNQQIEALAAYQRGVDYRYSNTFNFGNTNDIAIGK